MNAENMRDLSRPLLRLLAASDLPQRIVFYEVGQDFAALQSQLGLGLGLGRTDWVVGCKDVSEAELLSLCAQVLAAGVPAVWVVGATFGRVAADTLLDVTLIDVSFGGTNLTGEAGKKSAKRRLFAGKPKVLQLDQIELPRRLLLGLVSTKDFPLDLRVGEEKRFLEALALLQKRGRVVDQGVAEIAVPEPAATTASVAMARDLQVSGCVACGICVKACPHHALTLEVEGDTAGLFFESSSCQGDLRCVAICPQKAITDGGALTWTELSRRHEEGTALLAEVPIARCKRCAATHADLDQVHCPSCRMRVQQGYGVSVDIEQLKKQAEAQRQYWSKR